MLLLNSTSLNFNHKLFVSTAESRLIQSDLPRHKVTICVGVNLS